MDHLIETLRSKDLTRIQDQLSQFNLQNGQSMSMEEAVATKSQMVDLLFEWLMDTTAGEIHVACLSALRILSRDNRSLDQLFLGPKIDRLLHLANLVGEEETLMQSHEIDSLLVVEAQKVLCNLIFNSTTIQRSCCTNSTIDGIMMRMRMYKNPQMPMEVKYFDMRMLFLLTALCPDVRPRVRDDYHGLIWLMEVVDMIVKSTQDPSERNMKKSLRRGRKGSGRNGPRWGKEFNQGASSSATSSSTMQPPVTPDMDLGHLLTDDEVNLIIDVLKVLFNLTCNLDRKVPEEEMTHYERLVGIVHDLLLSEARTKDRLDEIHSHTINLLTTMPPYAYGQLTVSVEEIGKIDSPLYEYEDTNMEAIAVIVDFLDRRLGAYDDPRNPQQRSIHESIAPVLICLSEMARSKRVIRKYLKCRVLPPLKEVLQRPEEGMTLRNKLVKLMTNPNTDLKELVADLLFVLCKESVGRLIKYTGYGNAAGLLARRGLMSAGHIGRSDKPVYSSDSDDSDTEEYLAYKDRINPVLGCFEEEKPNPLAGMSDEQKEHEAMQLVNMMDKMTRAGIVRPCQVGPDGKPHPVDHILQLKEGVTLPVTKGNRDSDSD